MTAKPAASSAGASRAALAALRRRGLWLAAARARLRALHSLIGSLRGRPLTSYHLLLGSSALLIVLGLLMVLSASSVTSYRATGSSFSLFQRQAAFVACGLPLMWIASRLPPDAYRRLAYPAMLVCVVALGLVFVPGLGETVNGGRSWLEFPGPIQIQPSEPAKVALVVWGADLLARKERLGLLGEWRHLLVPLLPGAGLIVLLVMMGNDLGTAFVLISIFLALLWVVGAPGRLFAGMVGLMGFVVSVLIVVEPYRVQRLTTFLNTFEHSQGSGYQSVQGIYALATGGVWGVGLGASREKWDYLPHAHTDYIFAIIGEELGLIGTVAVLVLFGVLGYAGLRVAGRVRDPFMRFAAAGMTAWIIVQACVNIGAVIGVVPVTGLPLPLVSYGGSALLTTMVALGMLLSFAKREPGAPGALAARGPGPLGYVSGWLGLRPKGR